jgi:hypothetical protein
VSDFLLNLARRGAGLAPIGRVGAVMEAPPQRGEVADVFPISEEIDERPATRQPGRVSAIPDDASPPRIQPPGVPSVPPALLPEPRPTVAALPVTPAEAPTVRRVPLAEPAAPVTPAGPSVVAPRDASAAAPGSTPPAPRREIQRAEPARPPEPRPAAAAPERATVVPFATPALSLPPRELVAADESVAVSRSRSAERTPVANQAPPGSFLERTVAVPAALPIAIHAVPVIEPAAPAPIFVPTAPAPSVEAVIPPAVRVHIGAIELHAAPPTPATSASPIEPPASVDADTSGVFEGFTRVRRYAAWTR